MLSWEILLFRLYATSNRYDTPNSGSIPEHWLFIRFSDFQKRIHSGDGRWVWIYFVFVPPLASHLPLPLFHHWNICWILYLLFPNDIRTKNRCTTLHPFDSHILSYQNTFFSGVMFNVFEPPTVFIIPPRCKSSISSLSISISNCTSFRIFCILSTTKPCSKSKVYPNPAKFNNSPQKKKRPRNWMQYEKNLKRPSVTWEVRDGTFFSEMSPLKRSMGSVESASSVLLLWIVSSSSSELSSLFSFDASCKRIVLELCCGCLQLLVVTDDDDDDLLFCFRRWTWFKPSVVVEEWCRRSSTTGVRVTPTKAVLLPLHQWHGEKTETRRERSEANFTFVDA